MGIFPFIMKTGDGIMIQICQKEKEKVYDAICSGSIDVAQLSFPNLIDDIVLAMKRHGLPAPLQTLWKTAVKITAASRLTSSLPFP